MEKQIKKYLSAVKRRLNLPKEFRNRLLSDLQTTITARLEQGESWEAISASLGSPAQVAEGYMEQMKEFAYRKSPWRFAFLAAAALCCVRFVQEWTLGIAAKILTVYMMAQRSEASGVGIIGGADGPTAVFITDRPAVDTWVVVLIFAVSVLCYLRLCRCKQK